MAMAIATSSSSTSSGAVSSGLADVGGVAGITVGAGSGGTSPVFLFETQNLNLDN